MQPTLDRQSCNPPVSQFKGIPIVPTPIAARGRLRAAAKNTARRKVSPPSRTASRRLQALIHWCLGRKPQWLRAPMPAGSKFDGVRALVKEHRLATVCEEAKCPNIGECWNAGTATLMLMGAVCTRACRFCSVDTGNPRGWLDQEEPRNSARTVQLMRLKYVVLTSVNRDDLADGGAAHFAACVREIKQLNPGDGGRSAHAGFSGQSRRCRDGSGSGLEVFAQNVETVRRLTHPVRDPRASYEQTLDGAGARKEISARGAHQDQPDARTGETTKKSQQAMDDIRAAGVDILTLGQYLRPTPNHLPIERWVDAGGIRDVSRLGACEGISRMCIGAAGAIELSCRACARAQQRRTCDRRKRRRTVTAGNRVCAQTLAI